jgi:hypothetical protein
MAMGFSWINHLREAVLTASSEVSSLPAANMLADHLCDVWRSDAMTACSITAALPAARPVRFLGIFGASLSALATARLRLSNEAIGGGEVADTAVANLGAAEVNVVAGVALRQALIILPETVGATFMQLDLDDPGAAKTYVQIGALWLGDISFPKFGRSFGAKEGLVDPSDAVRSIGGQLYVNVRDAARNAQFDLDFLTDAEIHGWVRQMDLAVRKSGHVVMIPETNLDYVNADALLGVLSDIPATTNSQVNIRQRQYQIEEVL